MSFRALFIIPVVLVACSDPAKDKPAATVSDPAPAAAPAEALKAAEVAKPAAPGAGLAVSPANSKIGFVGAKITGSHAGKFEKFSGTITLGDKTET
jgi:polyisoprenoid-binding protein YceI